MSRVYTNTNHKIIIYAFGYTLINLIHIFNTCYNITYNMKFFCLLPRIEQRTQKIHVIRNLLCIMPKIHGRHDFYGDAQQFHQNFYTHFELPFTTFSVTELHNNYVISMEFSN